jgi:dipeptidyl aminopeptidase/acylaminoacyl peptidase
MYLNEGNLEVLKKFIPKDVFDNIPKSQLRPLFSGNNLIMTAEDLMSMNRLSEPQLSPDAKWLLYAVAEPNIETNKMTRYLYVIAIDRSKTIKVTDGSFSVYNPRWSPDGKKIAYLSPKSGSMQIHTLDWPSLSNDKQITKMPEDVGNMSYSPDGRYFSFTSDVKILKNVLDKYPKYPKAKIRIYEKLPIRHWSEWEDEKYSHLFIMPSDGGDAYDIMPNEPYDTPLKPFGGTEQIAWSPDGLEIAYTSKKVDKFAESTNSDIYTYNLDNKLTFNINIGTVGYDQEPLYSPDGKYIAFISLERASFESDKRRLMIYDRKLQKTYELSKQLDQWTEEFLWSRDSKSLYLTATDSGCVQLFNMALPDGEWKVISIAGFNYGGGLAINADNNMLVFGKQSMTQPMDFWKMDLNDYSQKQITYANDEMMSSLKIPPVSQKWITAKDGQKIHCYIIYPPDFDPAKKYPMITYCQGGPQSMISQNFHFRWNYMLMASKGYIVVASNRRGVPGFGQKWNDAISKDWGGMPMEDFLSVTDEMVKEPYIDVNGLAALGASAGGYATFWLAGNHNKRFKAFISHCGVFNLESMYGETEELWFPNWEYGGPYWDTTLTAFYQKHSPHRYAQNWDTPIMISTGENDFRVPYTQSLEAYTVAQVKGIPSKLVVFPEETHFIAKPQEFIIWSNEFFEFLDKYCKKSNK